MEVTAEVTIEIFIKVTSGLKISNRTELNLDCGSGDP